MRAKITAEGLRVEATQEARKATNYLPDTYGRWNHERRAAALTIAARVLDDAAVEGLARVMATAENPHVDPDRTFRDGTREWEMWKDEASAVLAYLRGEVE